ncbi:MAG: hypothetical protein A3A04_00590 [Candidatus Harrisonbacteria bacterium RIFCSPLOWO2_01_FULL_40_28]|uniref:Methyltransferase domain-containing protein n=1 Tax=Candidatus Harrisonbacteria bacterium RIFCSPLOWO2_01_FULL_40_28 TaxID=1798406 RepID=A0A1G1ZQM6_9BACT|nr:MAG: hypothetical protein A3A04_00590 [Candidatus Harrisonbacteria bacterium RIFCSPLOWO2_01_FULL_40_28]
MNQIKPSGIVTQKEIEELWGITLDSSMDKKMRDYDFSYQSLNEDEKEYWLQFIERELVNPRVVKAGDHRLDEWEGGWGENLKAFISNPTFQSLIPRYYGKRDIVRWNRTFIKPSQRGFEYNMHALIQEYFFRTYLQDIDSIYEFGCGTGHNLLRAGRVNQRALLYGLDWAETSQRIIETLSRSSLVSSEIKGFKFDFFKPDYLIKLNENSGVYTSGALEQVHDQYEAFIEYLIKNKPSLCINMEIMRELMDQDNEMDAIVLRYAEKRNYLKGFLTYLKKLESKNIIKIHLIKRLYVGTLFIESPSCVVWSPL